MNMECLNIYFCLNWSDDWKPLSQKTMPHSKYQMMIHLMIHLCCEHRHWNDCDSPKEDGLELCWNDTDEDKLQLRCVNDIFVVVVV